MNDIVLKSATELGALIKARKLSPVEVTQAFLDRIEALNPKLNAFITITADIALARARQAEKEISSGRYLGPLHGVPYAAKDLFATKGIRTTNGSKATADWIPDYESTATDRLNRAGAILAGKVNLSEFAYGGDAVLSGFGPPRNPWHTDYSAAGSSNGSGVAVAARLVPVALGTDTGGSIRLPSCFCGIVGLKPTYGRVSKFGVTPLSWTEDHAGPMTVTAADTAMVLQVIAGADAKDRCSANETVPRYTDYIKKDVRGLRIALLKPYFENLHPGVEKNVRAAVAQFEALGATTGEINLTTLKYVVTVTSTIFTAEAACFHEQRLRNKAGLLDPFLRARLEGAKFYTATDYIKAQRVRRMIIDEVHSALTKFDVILSPTMAVPAYKLDLTGGDPNRGPVLTMLADVTGIPAIAIPCGFTDGPPALPTSVMLHAKPFDEATLLRFAHAYQSATNYHEKVPAL